MIILAVSDVFNSGYKQFRAVPPPGTEFDTLGLSHFASFPLLKCN